MSLPSVAADVRRLKPLGREGRSEPPYVGCYQWRWFLVPTRVRNLEIRTGPPSLRRVGFVVVRADNAADLAGG
jgi:hypothetical protein